MTALSAPTSTALSPATLLPPTEATLKAVRRLLDAGARDEAEAWKLLTRWYAKADPAQLSIIVSHWLDAATPAEVEYVEVPVVVTKIAHGRLVSDEPLATLKVNPVAETERETD